MKGDADRNGKWRQGPSIRDPEKGFGAKGFWRIPFERAIKVLCWSRGAKVKLKPFGRQFVDQVLR